VDAKSILDILSLAAGKGTTLTIRSRGSDARACVAAILGLVRKQFEEAGQ
jgi:phosphocarrier protein